MSDRNKALCVMDDKTPILAPEYLDGAKSPVAHPSAPNTHRESSENYPAVVSMLDSKTRVIECADGIQWVIQRRRGRIWQGIYFCRTKAGLLLYAHPVTPELLALPDYFPEGCEDSRG
jgi:hypothetical protein